jgi:hypothetical protein
MICPRPECPIERARKAINETLSDSKRCEGETVMSCTFCGETRGWKRDKSGNERALLHHEIWGEDTKRSA